MNCGGRRETQRFLRREEPSAGSEGVNQEIALNQRMNQEGFAVKYSSTNICVDSRLPKIRAREHHES